MRHGVQESASEVHFHIIYMPHLEGEQGYVPLLPIFWRRDYSMPHNNPKNSNEQYH